MKIIKKVLFPNGGILSPGEVDFQVNVSTWEMVDEIETLTSSVVDIETHTIPDQPGDFWSLHDLNWKITSTNDETFWGPGGKESFLNRIKKQHETEIVKLADEFGWDLDDNFNPLPGAVVFSKTEFESQNKHLMAHIMAELKIFPSVSQARKNGWDKPIEIGDFSVTKKKIRFKVVE